jgi:predicted small secreted protein
MIKRLVTMLAVAGALVLAGCGTSGFLGSLGSDITVVQ